MCCLVHNFFKLIRIFVLNSGLDGVNKGFGFAQTLIKKVFKVFLGNKNIGLIFYLLMVVVLAKQGCIFKESNYKKYPFLIFGTNSCKIVITLLEEVIIL